MDGWRGRAAGGSWTRAAVNASPDAGLSRTTAESPGPQPGLLHRCTDLREPPEHAGGSGPGRRRVGQRTGLGSRRGRQHGRTGAPQRGQGAGARPVGTRQTPCP